MNKEIVPIERIAGAIHSLRGQRVMLGFDRPYAFTEQGVAMLSSGLNSERAGKFAELEKRVGEHDEKIDAVLEAIRQLMAPPGKPHREIGFHVRETAPRYRTLRHR